jgi:hypothetical protein
MEVVQAPVLKKHPETVLKPKSHRTDKLLGGGAVHWNSYWVGTGSWDVLAKCTGWSFGTAVPAVVLCQTRQADNQDHGWGDQFVTQVVETGFDFVRIRIRRIDGGPSGISWGQNLRLDVVVFE